MIRIIQTFRVRFAKRLIFGLLVLICYAESLLSYKNIQEEPSISIFLSAAYPDQEQMESILDMDQDAEEKIPACFYWDGGITDLYDQQYGRSASALLGGLYGEASLYDQRLNGFAQDDKKGCVIDERTAEELFGTRQAEGSILSLQGQEYVVRMVLPWKQQIILIRPDQAENAGTRLFLEETKESREATVRQFMLSCGLTGTVVQGDFLKTAAGAGLMLCPAVFLLFLLRRALSERKGHTEKEAGYWMWSAAVLLLIAAAVFFFGSKIEIPRDWIPGQWSDFTFWQEKIQTLRQEIRMYLMLPKTVLQTENILLCFQSAVFSLGAVFLSIFWKRV